jgi:hypothetical protein
MRQLASAVFSQSEIMALDIGFRPKVGRKWQKTAIFLVIIVNRRANRGNCCIFLTVPKRDEPPVARRPAIKAPSTRRLFSRATQPAWTAGKFPRGRVLVDNAAGDAARDLRLDLLQRLGGVGLLARRDRRLDGLDEGPDAADSRMVDRRRASRCGGCASWPAAYSPL